MNIVISDEEMARMVNDEFVKMRTRPMWGDSSFEKAIKQAIQEIVKDRIKEMVKTDAILMGTLKKSLEENISQGMAEFGKKVANAICGQLEEGIEAEFRSYG